MTTDLYEAEYPTAISPGRAGYVVTPDDANDLPGRAKALMVASVSGGAVLQFLPVDNADGDWIEFDAVVANLIIPFQVRRVGTNTTCTVVAVDR